VADLGAIARMLAARLGFRGMIADGRATMTPHPDAVQSVEAARWSLGMLAAQLADKVDRDVRTQIKSLMIEETHRVRQDLFDAVRQYRAARNYSTT
jgi:hypothetical protein